MTDNPQMDRRDYKWDGDSRDERPGEFAHSGYSTTAGVFHSTFAQQPVRRKRRARLAGVLVPVLAALGVSAMLLWGLVTHLRG